ncbi:MAG: WG repeat-containing protein [Nitrospira sp.]|nr:WG repeat-containing protein [Nitrospira sp.]
MQRYISKTGCFAILPQFDNAAVSVDAIDARSFSEGLATVLTNGKWGFIDKTGMTTIPPQFEEDRPFSDGLAAMRIGGKK